MALDFTFVDTLSPQAYHVLSSVNTTNKIVCPFPTYGPFFSTTLSYLKNRLPVIKVVSRIVVLAFFRRLQSQHKNIMSLHVFVLSQNEKRFEPRNFAFSIPENDDGQASKPLSLQRLCIIVLTTGHVYAYMICKGRRIEGNRY